MLEGSRPCTSFVLHPYTMHELCYHNASIGQVLRMVNPPNSEQKPTTKNLARFHNHFPLNYGQKGC